MCIGVAAGGSHSCAVRDGDGHVACWGRNDDGESTPPSPGRVVVAVSGGYYFSMALNASDGKALYVDVIEMEGNGGDCSVWCFVNVHETNFKHSGWGNSGNVGTTPDMRLSDMSDGGFVWHTCGVAAVGGGVRCWGSVSTCSNKILFMFCKTASCRLHNRARSENI